MSEMKETAAARAAEQPEDSDEPQDDSSSVGSTSTADVSSRGDTPTQRRRRRRGRKPAPAHCKVEYRYSAHAREEHGQPLFGVQFNPYLRSCSEQAVATCGGPRLSVYELTGGRWTPSAVIPSDF